MLTTDAQNFQPRASTASLISSHSFKNRLLQRHPRCYWWLQRMLLPDSSPISDHETTSRRRCEYSIGFHSVNASTSSLEHGWLRSFLEPHRNTCAARSRQLLTCRIAASYDLRRVDCFMCRAYEHVMDHEPSQLPVRLFGTVYHKPLETFPQS